MASPRARATQTVVDSRDAAGLIRASPASTGIVAVTGDTDAETWLAGNRDVVSAAAAVTVVSAAETVRSTTVDTAGTAPVPTVAGVPSVDDLGALGRTVTEQIRSFEDRGLTPIIVFDGVEALVDAAGLEPTFRVLHLLGSRVSASNGELVTVLPEDLPADVRATLAALAD